MFGYLLIGTDKSGHDFQRLSYALSLSLHNTQHETPKVSLVTNKPVPTEWQHLFDQVIIVDGDFNKVAFRYDMYDLSPYEETIHIESDSIIFNDISHWWEHFRNNNCYLKFARKIVDTYGDTISVEKHPSHRTVYKVNCIPYDLRTSIFWWKKDDRTKLFFDKMKDVALNFEEYNNIHTPHIRNPVSFDAVTAMTCAEFGNWQDIRDHEEVITFCHAKEYVIGYDWTKLNEVFTHGGDCFIDGVKQKDSLHYQTKQWMTDSKLKILEDVYARLQSK